jgi:hypothetical protein
LETTRVLLETFADFTNVLDVEGFAFADTVVLRPTVFELDFDWTAPDEIPVRQRLKKSRKSRREQDGLIIRC